MSRFPDRLPANPSFAQITRAYNELRQFLADNCAMPGCGIQPVQTATGTIFNVIPGDVRRRGEVFCTYVNVDKYLEGWVEWINSTDWKSSHSRFRVASTKYVRCALHTRARVLHYVYQDAVTKELCHATWDGWIWTSESTGVAAPASGYYNAFIQIDSTGEPYIIYHAIDTSPVAARQVYALRKSKTTWSQPELIYTLKLSFGRAPYVTSFCLDANNKWHMLAVRYNGAGLYLVYYINEDGVDEPITAGGDPLRAAPAIELPPTIAISPAGTVWVSGMFFGGDLFRYAYRTGAAAWTSITVQAAYTSYGQAPVIGAIDDGENVLMGYYHGRGPGPGYVPRIFSAVGDTAGVASEEITLKRDNFPIMIAQGVRVNCGIDRNGDPMIITSDTSTKFVWLCRKPYADNTIQLLDDVGYYALAYGGSLLFVGQAGCRTRNQFLL